MPNTSLNYFKNRDERKKCALLSKATRLHTGKWFETILILNGYEIIETDNSVITVFLINGMEKSIDPSSLGLMCQDPFVEEALKLIKSLYCLEQIERNLAKDTYYFRWRDKLNIYYKYLQIKALDSSVNDKFNDAQAVVAQRALEYKLKSLGVSYGLKHPIKRFLACNGIAKEKVSLNLKERTIALLPTSNIHLINYFEMETVSNEEAREFELLLRDSLSLNYEEKLRVIKAMPTLSRFQIDELKKVFLEEQERFEMLGQEHPEDVNRLLMANTDTWLKLQQTEYFHKVVG